MFIKTQKLLELVLAINLLREIDKTRVFRVLDNSDYTAIDGLYKELNMGAEVFLFNSIQILNLIEDWAIENPRVFAEGEGDLYEYALEMRNLNNK